MIELLCLYKAFVIFDLLHCMAFTISDENKQLKIFFVFLTLTFKHPPLPAWFAHVKNNTKKGVEVNQCHRVSNLNL